MLCSDLDRYLEAFVDGRLGRSRTIILRRHLGGCARCRTKVDRLRQFEREIASRLRTIPDGRSVWHGLDQDLARNAGGATTALLSSPRVLGVGGRGARTAPAREPGADTVRPARSRRRLSQLLGVVALALAVGAVWELARDWLDPIFNQLIELDGGAPPAVHAASPVAEHLAN